MKKILAAGTLVLLNAGPLLAVANPSSVFIRVFEMRLSPNDDCSNAITVFTNPAGTAQDFVQGPTLGTGAIPNGTYRCMMIHMSDTITYTPETTDGANCIQGTAYTRDLFRDGESGNAPDGTVIPGHGVSASNGTEDFPWAYFTIGGSNAGSCFSLSSKCLLSAPAVVTGDRTVTFVANFDGQIDGSFNPCELTGAEFSFR
jgi:hypothetical protein